MDRLVPEIAEAITIAVAEYRTDGVFASLERNIVDLHCRCWSECRHLDENERNAAHRIEDRTQRITVLLDLAALASPQCLEDLRLTAHHVEYIRELCDAHLERIARLHDGLIELFRNNFYAMGVRITFKDGHTVAQAI